MVKLWCYHAHIGNYGVNENEVESGDIRDWYKISVSITLELIPLKV
jgi:hypothetical protein